MDIYAQKTRWKVLLAILAGIFLVFIAVYSNYISSKLAEGERDKVIIFETLYPKISNLDDLNADVTTEVEIFDRVNHMPIILEQSDGTLKGWNLDGESEEQIDDQERLRKEVQKLQKSGFEPLEGIGYASKVWYKNTKMYDRLKLFPYLMLILSALFVGLCYYLFNSARNAEQSRVWAGMAKETAHQLGTPISAIIAWIEHLKLEIEDESQLEIVQELRDDVTRLELVADRFSKIGSAPELDEKNIVNQLQQCMGYMARRAPKRVKFELENENTMPLAMINSHLFNWVIENIYRNALDAMDGKGYIDTKVYEQGDKIAIDIADTGKGIPSSKHKTVFQPGFSTKKRGWGLGLSLAKRIIEHYHKGKIFVKESKVDHGTTFAIRLPKV